jgi:hypothetical protein
MERRFAVASRIRTARPELFRYYHSPNTKNFESFDLLRQLRRHFTMAAHRGTWRDAESPEGPVSTEVIRADYPKGEPAQWTDNTEMK